MLIRSFPGMYALRYPFFAPDEDLGGGEGDPDPAFIEQPGDREEEPAGDPPPAAEEEPPAEGEEEPPAAEGEEEEPPAAEAEEEAEGEAPAPRKDWRDRQIIKARKAEKEANERATALAAENAELRAAQGAEGEGAVLTDAERKRIRDEAAIEIRTEQRFKTINERCDAMFDAGAKAFPKTWETSVVAAGEVFGEEMRARPDFLEAVTDLDNAAAVYHDLASDPDKMEEVLNLAPHKMGMELAKISARLAQAPRPKPISRVPAPITPLDGPTLQERSMEDLANDPSDAAMREFDRRMAADEAKRARAR